MKRKRSVVLEDKKVIQDEVGLAVELLETHHLLIEVPEAAMLQVDFHHQTTTMFPVHQAQRLPVVVAEVVVGTDRAGTATFRRLFALDDTWNSDFSRLRIILIWSSISSAHVVGT
jgi:hypothetical protein